MDRLISMSFFVEVVNKRSFSCAARQLKLSQGAVTGHVQSLEQQLGLRLLNQTTRKVSLTEEGIQFYQRCIRILAEVAEIEDLATSLRQTPRGRLRLNTDVTLARVVAPVASEYMLTYPEVSVELIMTDQISDLVEGTFDLAIHAGSALESSLIQRRLGKVQRVVCASPIYLARRSTPRTPRDLNGQQLPQCQQCKSHASLAICQQGGRARGRGHGKSVQQQHRGRPSGGAQRARRLPAATAKRRRGSQDRAALACTTRLCGG